MTIYDRLGVRPVVNAAGTLTRLGGTIMCAEALEAMREAARSAVAIEELQEAASRVIAGHTGAEAGLVTPGAFGALALAAGACIAGLTIYYGPGTVAAAHTADEYIELDRYHAGVAVYERAIRAFLTTV